MSDCRYCNMLDNGGTFPDDYKELLNFRIPFIHEIKLEGEDIDLECTVDGVPFEYTIPVGRKKIKLESAVGGEVGVENNCIYILLWDDDGEEIFSKKNNINFCPMCGRKL